MSHVCTLFWCTRSFIFMQFLTSEMRTLENNIFTSWIGYVHNCQRFNIKTANERIYLLQFAVFSWKCNSITTTKIKYKVHCLILIDIDVDF